MRRASLFDELSRRVPAIVAAALCAALVADWLEAPAWLPYGLAIGLVGLALVMMARRRRPPADAEETSWLDRELAGNGSPPGTYLLGFFGVVTVALTGFQGAYALPGWAALALTAAWAVANASDAPREGAEG